MKNHRRNFLKKGSALAMLSLTGLGATRSNLLDLGNTLADKREDNSLSSQDNPRMKIALQASTEPSEDQIKLIKQMGLDEATTGTWAGQKYSMPLSHEREYTNVEIWENFAYFIKEVAPVHIQQLRWI